MRVRVLITALFVTSPLWLTGCASDAEKQEAARQALNKIVVGGTLGDCLNIAGYDVRPDYVADGTITAPGDGWWRVAFQNEADSGQFIRVGVNTEGSLVIPYKRDDKAALEAIGCAVNGPTLL